MVYTVLACSCCLFNFEIRNEAFCLSKVNRVECIAKDVKSIVQHRIFFCKSVKWSNIDCNWLNNL